MKSKLLVAVCWTLLIQYSAHSQSVGIGTETPNSNAILELVAPNNNQGLLVPRMTTDQRNSVSFTENLSSLDNGLMVYDSDEDKFYFWISGQWIALATGNLGGLPDQQGQIGKFLSTDGSNSLWTTIDFASLTNIPSGLSDGDDVDDEDADAFNELQDLSLATNTLSLSGSASTIDLSGYLDNTDSQDLSFVSGVIALTGDPDVTNIDLSNYDSDMSDDFDGDFTSLTSIPTGLSDGDDVNDADADPENELQDLTLTANTLSLTNSGVDIDLNAYTGTNTDNQTLSLSGSDLSITDGNTLNISSINTNLSEAEVDAFVGNNGYLTSEVDGSTSNEFNTSVGLNGTSIEITDAGGTLSQDLDATFATDAELTASDAADGDKDDANEIQDISTDGTAGDITLSDGSSLTLNVDDGDADDSNEFQDLTLSGNTLSLTNSAVDIDLSPFSGTNTDNQTLSLSGADLTISGGNTLDISSVNTNLTEGDVDAFVSNNGYLTTEVDGSIANELQTVSKSGNTVTLSNGGGSFSVADDDNSTTNEIQDLSLSTNTLSLSGSATTVDLSSYLDDTNLTEAEVDAFVSDNGYLTAEVDGSTANELQTISRTGLTVSLSNSGGSFNVADNDNSTSNEIQDLSLSTNTLSLSGSATTINLAPYLDDTNLSEAEVDAFVSDNGYLTSEVDGSTSNELQTVSKSGNTVTLSNGGGSFSVADNDNSTSNEIQDLSLTTNTLSLSGSVATVNLAPYLDNTNLSEAEVDAFVSDNGYLTAEVDGSIANELQTISRSGLTVTLSNSGGSFIVADNDNSTANELQTVSKSGNTVTLSNSGGSFSVADNDNSASNEVQTISRSGDNVRLSINNSSANVLDFTPSFFKATTKNSSTIAVGNTVLVFEQEVYDIDGSYDTGGTYTAPEDGYYNFSGLMIFQDIPSGLVRILIRDGDSNILYSKSFAPNSINSSITFSTDLQLTAGDKISLAISNTTLGGNEATSFEIIGAPDQTNFFFCGKRFN